ncbi:MAG: hypothetical protein IKJ92_05290 [Bacteroidaceae bacterium]|nr:hypothetical protein [Bacteroidaceae bacterium]
MKTKNIFLAMIVALMSTVICPAQEGESTKEGIAVVEEIVTDTDSSTDNGGGSNAATQHTTGSWTVTYTNDTLDTDEAVELLEEIFDEEFPEGIEGLMKTAMGAATGGLLIAGLVLFCIFVLPILGIILIIWLIVRASRGSGTNAGQAAVQTEVDETGRDRTLFNKGVRNVCLGLGLAVFLGIWMGDFGVGIGVLVVCIGIGELLVDYFAKK